MINKNIAICAALGTLFWGSVITLGATGNLNTNFSYAFEIGSTQPAGQIGLDRVELTTSEVRGYRSVTPIQGNVVAANAPFTIYLEPTSLSARFTPSTVAGQQGALSGSMTVDFEIRNNTGAIVATQNSAWKVPVTIAADRAGQLQNVFSTLRINGLPFQPGSYKLLLRVHDDTAGRFTTRVIDLQIGGQATATLTPGGRR